MAEKMRDGKVRCSFCHKSEDQVRKLIAGPEGVFICDECIGICSEIMEEELAQYDTEDVYVIGGGSIYKQMLQYCDTAYITYVDHEYAADTFIPNLDQMTDEWQMVEEGEENTYFDLEYYFRIYKRIR